MKIACGVCDRCVFITLELAFHFYRVSGSSFNEVCHVSTVARNRNTKH